MLAQMSGNDGMDRRQVARWERGKRIPSRYWRDWIGVALDVPVVRLDRAAALAQFLRAAPDVGETWAQRPGTGIPEPRVPSSDLVVARRVALSDDPGSDPDA